MSVPVLQNTDLPPGLFAGFPMRCGPPFGLLIEMSAKGNYEKFSQENKSH